MSLLRTGYLSSTANVLKAVPRLVMSIRETFSNPVALKDLNKYVKVAVMQISTVFGTGYHVPLQGVL